MNGLDKNRWNELWGAEGAQLVSWYDRLAALYSEPHRHYHNGRHILECFREFDSAPQLAQQPVAVQLAIWFHDAIYDPRASDNEERSAALAKQCLAGTRLNPQVGEAVAQLVLATKQHDGSLHVDAPLLVDIDLSILGQVPERFQEYEKAIRQEYEWVPRMVFTMKRAEILTRFISRERIYRTDHFFQKYEQQARINLADSVQRLGRG